ncbi:HemY protein [Durusdinium trenchii]|uniref:HemY protein n=1 Tax=Durusdinium trenchii TaxID=1381693 RepID=A0ABP0NF82_9DINO
MPGHLQRDPALAAQYAGYLAQLGDGEGALKQVRKTMEHGWDDRLPAVLESISNVAPERLLAQLEQWLSVRPGNASLLLTAGRVALRAQLWGKARSFFNEAANAGSLVALEEQLRLSAAMGDRSQAESLQQRRLALLSQSLPELPLPQKRRAWHGRMKELAETADQASERLAAVRHHWRAMPGHLQRDPALAAQYAGYLAQLGDGEGALKQVRKTMEHGWDDRLPAVLESISNVAPERLLAQLEQWLSVRPGNASLLLTAGRVALRAQLWGKARSFFNEAANAGSLVALEEQLRLSAAMGDRSQAESLQQRRLALLSQSLPELPLPQKRPEKDPR